MKELASSPLLLTLLCLVFGEAGDLPRSRAELYKEGVDLLLKKWDGKRNIQRDEVYKNLSNQWKENLLGQLALATFESGEYFFKQEVAEKQIIDYIRNLPGAKEEPNKLQVDSEEVLKAIQAQHGLLVERARGVYSFSHLTFHEYFAAREVADRQSWETLSNHMLHPQWEEVILLTMESLRNGDRLIRTLKEYTDQLLANDPGLQRLLSANFSRASKFQSTYTTSEVRAIYFSISLFFNLVFDCDSSSMVDACINLTRIPYSSPSLTFELHWSGDGDGSFSLIPIP